MRKSNSKVLNTPKASTATGKAKPSSNGRTKAKCDSETHAIDSAPRTTRGNNTREPSSLRRDARLNGLLKHSLDLKNDKKFDQAAEAFAQIVEEYPECAPANGLLGSILLLDLKRPRDALPYCRKATELAPKSEMASLGLFHALWKADQIDDALEEIKRFQLLTNWSCNDYREIVAEINEKWADSPKPKKKAKPKKAHP